MSVLGKSITGLAAALALCSTSSIAAVATVAPAAPAQVHPYAVIGLYGSEASAQLLCGSAGVSASAVGEGCMVPAMAASAATTAAAAQTIDQPRYVSPGVPPLPVLLVLAGWVGLTAYILLADDDNESLDLIPVSPA